MRPPILFLAIAFGVGVYAGLESFVGRGTWYVVVPVLGTALALGRTAPRGAALGIMGVAGTVWGAAAGRERAATCAGTWGKGNGERSRAAIVRLVDPAPASGGVVDADVVPGPCGGPVRLRWPEQHLARGGTEWVVAGRWSGVADRGVLVVRRLVQLNAVPRGRGALRDRLAARSAEQLGAAGDRKSTRLNSSHANISYAVFCLKKKKAKN